MDRNGLTLTRSLAVERLYSVHYFELSKAYTFPGERHNFGEPMYVDKCEILVTAENREFPLHSGGIPFH